MIEMQLVAESSVNSPADLSVQTSNNNFSNNSVASLPCLCETLEQMCTTVTFLAEQIMQIKNRLATINSTTDSSE